MCIRLPKDPVHYPSVSVFESQVGICFTLPLFNKDRVQFEFNAIYFFSLPASEGKDVIVERTAAVSADIE